MAFLAVITHVLQKAKKCPIYQEIGGCYKVLFNMYLQNSLLIRSISNTGNWKSYCGPTVVRDGTAAIIIIRPKSCSKQSWVSYVIGED